MKLKERWRNWKQGNEIQNICLLPDFTENDEIEKSTSSLSQDMSHNCFVFLLLGMKLKSESNALYWLRNQHNLLMKSADKIEIESKNMTKWAVQTLSRMRGTEKEKGKEERGKGKR